MKQNQVVTCICLQYIGDHGPCPVHGDPNSQARGYFPPRIDREQQPPQPKYDTWPDGSPRYHPRPEQP